MSAVVPDEPVVPSPGEPEAGPVAGPGATVVVTGGTGGIGLASATALAARGARVLLLGRDPVRGARAEAAVGAAARTAGDAPDALPRFVSVDLSSLAAVADAAAEVRRTVGRPDVVVANAGGLYTDRWETVDGLEASLAMNLVSPVALVDQLAADGEHGRRRTRVVAVSSGVVHQVRPARDDPQSAGRYSPMSAYGRTKLYGAAAVLALGRDRDDLDVVLADPGGAATDMTAAMTWRTVPWFLRPMVPVMKLAQRRMSTEQASRSTVRAATDAAVPSGAWLGPRSQLRPLPRALRDPALGDWSLALARELADTAR